MKLAPFLLVLVALAPVRPALAHDSDCWVLGGDGSSLHFRGRCEPAEARFAADSRDGDITLLLTDRAVAMQLSDRALHRITRELRAEQDEDGDCALAVAIKTVVLSSVRSLLDHSAQCPLRDLRDVEYRDGELVFTTWHGEHPFRHIDVHDESATRGFSARDAQEFVRQFHRLQADAR